MDEDSIKQAQIDAADIHAERAGLETGRIERFVHATDERSLEAERKKDSAWQSFQSLLQRYLDDPVYRAAWERVNDLLSEVQDKLDAALEKVTAGIERLEALIEAQEDNAVKLPDGTAVFRAADGSVRTADGRLLKEAETASLTFPEGLPSWEHYSDARDALQSARARRDKLIGIQEDVIDPARDKLNDPDDPAQSVDEIEGIEDRLREAEETIDQLTSNDMSASFNRQPTTLEQTPAQRAELEAIKIPSGTL